MNSFLKIRNPIINCKLINDDNISREQQKIRDEQMDYADVQMS